MEAAAADAQVYQLAIMVVAAAAGGPMPRLDCPRSRPATLHAYQLALLAQPGLPVVELVAPEGASYFVASTLNARKVAAAAPVTAVVVQAARGAGESGGRQPAMPSGWRYRCNGRSLGAVVAASGGSTSVGNTGEYCSHRGATAVTDGGPGGTGGSNSVGSAPATGPGGGGGGG